MITFHHYEFELAVREDTQIYDRPIKEQDFLKVEHLDCSNFDFHHEDLDTLEKCRALKSLDINIGMIGLYFLSSFPMLEDLYLVYWGRAVDFRAFTCLQKLKSLGVSGGELSSIPFIGTDSLPAMKNLTSLTLHEFGTVDLSFLENMPWLEKFYCGWANEAANIPAIGKLVNLRELSLFGLQMDDLDFLDSLPDTMTLMLGGDEVSNGFDPEKLRRFQQVDVYEMTAGGKPVC